MNKKEERAIEKKVLKELEPVIQKLKGLYEELDNMVEAGILTREQVDDMTGASLDKEDKIKKK